MYICQTFYILIISFFVFASWLFYIFFVFIQGPTVLHVCILSPSHHMQLCCKVGQSSKLELQMSLFALLNALESQTAIILYQLVKIAYGLVVSFVI